VGTWHDPDLGRPIAAPLERCAELLGVDLATIREAAANVEPYIRADGRRIWTSRSWSGSFGPRCTAGGEAATSTDDEPRPATHRTDDLVPAGTIDYAGGRPHLDDEER
jgi:hypothetical protein